MKDELPKIHFWPNLMTAGNLFCGFTAMRLLITNQGDLDVVPTVIWLILGACIFDMLDGRIARAIGEESPFGREFDSLADIVSFGVAPALLMHYIVLDKVIPDEKAGWFIAFFYVLCGAIRLARFNCLALMTQGKPSRDFTGCPIPAAAGVIASVTLLFLDPNPEAKTKKFLVSEGGSWVLPVLMIMLSVIMVSKLRYPSFKGLSWKTKRSIPWFIIAILVVVITIQWRYVMPAVIFVGYLFYGLIRPWVKREWRREIEDDPDEPEEAEEDTPLA